MPKGRTRDASATRADILRSARARFAELGYDRTTTRAVAADVGVDQALVNRYFGTKENLFAEAVEFKLDFPDLHGIPPERLADLLLPHFFVIWEEQGTFLALLRAAMTSEAAAAAMRRAFIEQVAPTLRAITPDHPHERAALFGSYLLGLATTRYILRTPAAANINHQTLIIWSRPVITHLLTGPLDS